MSNKVHAFCCGYAAQFLDCLHNYIKEVSRNTDDNALARSQCETNHTLMINLADANGGRAYAEKLYPSLLGPVSGEEESSQYCQLVLNKLSGLTQSDMILTSRSRGPKRGFCCAGNIWTRLFESRYCAFGGERYFDNGEVMLVGRPKGKTGSHGKDEDYPVTSENRLDDVVVSVVPTMGYFYEQHSDDDCNLYGACESLHRNETYRASRLITRSVRRLRVASESRPTIYITYFIDMGALFVRAMERFINTQMLRYSTMGCSSSNQRDVERVRQDLVSRLRDQEVVVWNSRSCVNNEHSRFWSDIEAALISDWIRLLRETQYAASDDCQTSRGLRRRVANSVANIPLHHIVHMVGTVRSNLLTLTADVLGKFVISDANDRAVQIWAEIAGYLTKPDILAYYIEHARILARGGFLQ